jgi:uncharacterized membrane protein YbhN (UPF0104 family)
MAGSTRSRWIRFNGWSWARLLGGALIVGLVLWRVGTGPFLDGVRKVDAGALAVGFLIAVPVTLCCAWRWTLVARGLGIAIPLRAAVAFYYRSQFLNTVLPGGVLGDVHRAVRHGRDVGDTPRGLRAVAWERLAGQVVQVAVAVVLLLLLPSPVRSSMPAVGAAVLVAVLLVVLLGRILPGAGSSLWARTLRATRSDVRGVLLARAAWPGITAASALAVVGHLLTFLVAARTAGSPASPAQLLPLALLVLLAMGLPTNVAGWGPREGVAAWAFAAAGLGADQGVATAVVYGVMTFVAGLPGAVVLVVAWLRRGSGLRDGAGRTSVGQRRGDPDLQDGAAAGSVLEEKVSAGVAGETLEQAQAEMTLPVRH